MKVHISPGMSKITISTTHAFLDPLNVKAAARYLSFRTAILVLLLTAVCLPFAFIFTAVVSLERLTQCKSGECVYFGRKLQVQEIKRQVVSKQAEDENGSLTGATCHCGLPSDLPQTSTTSEVLLGALRSGRTLRAVDREEFLPESLDDLAAEAEKHQYDATTVIRILKSMVEANDERERVTMLQRTLYKHFASKGIPKGLHCLSLRLTTEYSLNTQAQKPLPEPALAGRLTDNSLHHFVLITDNVFAASVVVRSAVSNAKFPETLVFHIVTEKMSYAAMYAWFSLNRPSPAVVEVLGIHQLEWLNKANVPVLELVEKSDSLKRHYFGDSRMDPDSTESPGLLAAKLAARNPKYISIMNHLRMYLPMVFPKLKKVVFLDDDVVVQKDLSPLWDIPLHGYVLGAVETCRGADTKVMSKRFKSYFNFSSPLIADRLDPEKCAWAYGMNIFDLEAWRYSNITEIYHFWQRKNMDSNLTLWRLGTLPPSLIAFDNYIKPIDPSWHMLGLGYQPESSLEAIQNAAVIHYNGAAKPWLEMAIPEFRRFWSTYVNYSNEFIRQCNIFDF